MKKLRLVMMCLACAGLLSAPAAAYAQKERPGGPKRGSSIKCRILQERVQQGGNEVAGAEKAVAKAKSKARKRKRAYNNSKSKKNKAKLRKAKRKLKAAKAELKADQQRLANENRRFAQAGCGG